MDHIVELHSQVRKRDRSPTAPEPNPTSLGHCLAVADHLPVLPVRIDGVRASVHFDSRNYPILVARAQFSFEHYVTAWEVWQRCSARASGLSTMRERVRCRPSHMDGRSR